MDSAGRGYSGYQSQGHGPRHYPSYSSRGRSQGYGPHHRQDSSVASEAAPGDNRGSRGYDPRMMYGRPPYAGRQRQGYTDRSGDSYSRDNPQRSGEELSNRGQYRGRGGRGRGGQVRPRSRSQGHPQPQSTLSSNQGENGFYSSRDYTASDQNMGQENRSRYPRGRGGIRGGYPGNIRGQGMGRIRGGGLGRGRGRGGNFAKGYKRVFPEFKSLVEFSNLPEDLTMKELRTSLKEIPLDPKFNIQFLYETKASVKILEEFNYVIEKLKELKFGEAEVEISEGKLKPNKFVTDGRRNSSAIYIKFVTSANSKVLEESLRKMELNPRLVLTGGKEPGVTFYTLGFEDVKEAKKKIKDLKVAGFEVGGVKIVRRKQSLMIVKLAPETGHLKLENLPKDMDPKKLKLKLKQNLAYSIHVGKIEDGKVDIRYSPKTMVVLEKLAGLVIGDNEVKVKEVDDGQDCHENSPNVDQLKFALPKDLTKENFDKILGKSIPNEIQLGKESFTLKFFVPSKVIKNVKKFVLDTTCSDIASMVTKSRDTSEDGTSKTEDDAQGGRREVKAVFGSTDIRYREEKAGSHEGLAGEKMRPSGETN